MRWIIKIILSILFLSACTVGPNYVRPPVIVPPHFKEAAPGWKIAHPQEGNYF
jgi:hypothetical protein